MNRSEMIKTQNMIDRLIAERDEVRKQLAELAAAIIDVKVSPQIDPSCECVKCAIYRHKWKHVQELAAKVTP